MRTRPLLAALLLLVTGGILALAIERVVQHHHGAPADPNAALHAHFMTDLASAVDLTPAQRDSIDRIFRRHQGMVDSAWVSINSHVHATMDSVRREIEGVLQPAQLTPFRDWVRRHHPSVANPH